MKPLPSGRNCKYFIFQTINSSTSKVLVSPIPMCFHRNHSSHKSVDESDDSIFPSFLDLKMEKIMLPGTKLGSSLSNSPSLVLNADYTPLSHLPLSIWHWQDTIRAVLAGKVEVVSEYTNTVVRGVSFEVKLPSVVALKTYQRCYDPVPNLTRHKVFLRDGYRCQVVGKNRSHFIIHSKILTSPNCSIVLRDFDMIIWHWIMLFRDQEVEKSLGQT